MRRGTWGGALGALAVAALASPGAARQADTVTLTLERALQIAEGSNPAYQRAANDVSLNPVEMRTTWMSELLPSMSLTLFDTGFNGNLRRVARDNFGNPIENPTADWVYFSNTWHVLNLGWRFQGASLFQTHRRQSLDNRSRELTEARIRSDLEVEIRRRYWEALEQSELTRTEEELLEARRVLLALTERLFGLAQRTRVDVLNAELGVEQQALALQRQSAQAEQALLALRTEMGDADLGPIRLAEAALPVFDPSELDADRLVATALEVNPRIAESRNQVEDAELGVREARNQWWPELSMGLTLYRRTDVSGGGGLFEPWPGQGLEQNFGLSFSLPFFNNYFQNRQSQYQASVQADNARQSVRETRLDVEQQVRSQLLVLKNEWESLRINERALAIAEEALALRREEYRLGTVTFEQLRQSVDAEATARRDVVMARHAFVDALLNLEAAVGTEVRN